jgi:hypothetical protein
MECQLVVQGEYRKGDGEKQTKNNWSSHAAREIAELAVGICEQGVKYNLRSLLNWTVQSGGIAVATQRAPLEVNR